MAQVERWKRQFSPLDPLSCVVEPVSQNGFAGLRFEGEGIWRAQPAACIAWTMRLDADYIKRLQPEQNSLCADYTIKAVGPRHLMAAYRQEILSFATSFELIEELPYPK